MFFLKDLPSREMLEVYKEDFPQMDVDDVQTALILLRRASILLRRIEAYFAKHGLSQTRFLILIVLDRELKHGKQGHLLAKEIAEKLDISRPIVTNTLKSMKNNGFIKINTHAQDGRAKLIMLTDIGCEKLYAVLPGYYSILHDFMNRDNDEF